MLVGAASDCTSPADDGKKNTQAKRTQSGGLCNCVWLAGAHTREGVTGMENCTSMARGGWGCWVVMMTKMYQSGPGMENLNRGGWDFRMLQKQGVLVMMVDEF